MRKISFRLLSFLLALLLAFSLASCGSIAPPSGGTPSGGEQSGGEQSGGEQSGGAGKIESFRILGSGFVEVELGGEYQIQTNLTAEQAKSIVWTPTNECVTITADGRILGAYLGMADVLGTVAGLTASLRVSVTKPSSGDPLPPAITPDNGASATFDPYENVSKAEFYKNYKPASSYWDAYHRSRHYLMSGSTVTPHQAPVISAYQPRVESKLLRNTDTYYSENGKAYTVMDAYGKPVLTVYYGGAYITIEEVAAYVFAFGDVPANYSADKDAEPLESKWGEYLRANHTYFSGSTSRYPYEPVLPNISGCGGRLRYMEIDIGTTGTDCDPKYPSVLYNNGSRIVRGAARIVYAKDDLNGNGVYERNEQYVFYTYNHYNDFREYLNYYGGWGEMFGNITGGGQISSKYNYNPTPYVEVAFASLSEYESVAVVFVLPPSLYKRMEI